MRQWLPRRFAIAFAACWAALVHAAGPIPPAAHSAIVAVGTAANHKDYAALQALMSEDFIWSYKGEPSAVAAIAEWQSHPKMLKELQRLTGLPCEQKSALVECAEAAKGGFRAGFKQTPAGWRMVYFVEGE
jgi:hypothetical protein